MLEFSVRITLNEIRVSNAFGVYEFSTNAVLLYFECSCFFFFLFPYRVYSSRDAESPRMRATRRAVHVGPIAPARAAVRVCPSPRQVVSHSIGSDRTAAIDLCVGSCCRRSRSSSSLRNAVEPRVTVQVVVVGRKRTTIRD